MRLPGVTQTLLPPHATHHQAYNVSSANEACTSDQIRLTDSWLSRRLLKDLDNHHLVQYTTSNLFPRQGKGLNNRCTLTAIIAWLNRLYYTIIYKVRYINLFVDFCEL